MSGKRKYFGGNAGFPGRKQHVNDSSIDRMPYFSYDRTIKNKEVRRTWMQRYSDSLLHRQEKKKI